MKPRREKNTWTPLEWQLRQRYAQEVAERRRQRIDAAAAEMRAKFKKSNKGKWSLWKRRRPPK